MRLRVQRTAAAAAAKQDRWEQRTFTGGRGALLEVAVRPHVLVEHFMVGSQNFLKNFGVSHSHHGGVEDVTIAAKGAGAMPNVKLPATAQCRRR